MLKETEIEKVLSVFRREFNPIPIEIYKEPFKLLVSVLLSARTKDEVTLKASTKLFKVADTPKKLLDLKIAEIERLIYPVGFYKTKAKHLKSLGQMLIKEFDGSVPTTREGLMRLPGVGRKTANLVLQRLGLENTIAVDTHVHKISNLLGWVNTKTPEQTEKELMKALLKKHWNEINSLFVSIGQQYRSRKKLEEFLRQNHLM